MSRLGLAPSKAPHCEADTHTLQRHGCDEFRGFLLARPAPAERLAHRQAAPAQRRPARFGVLATRARTALTMPPSGITVAR